MKKLFAFLTAAALVLTMSMGAFAATAGSIKDVDKKNFQAVLKENGTKKLILQGTKAITVDDLSNLKATPGQEIKIYLTANMFVDNQGTKISTDATHISRNQVRSAKLGLRRTSSRGSKAFKSIDIAYDKIGSYISVKIADQFVSLEDLDFATTLTLTFSNDRRAETQISIAGTLAADTVEVYADDDYVDLSGGRVAEAVERNTKIEVDLGNDLTVFASMVRGRKYYGTASLDISTADSKIMSKYTSITDVYTLKTINLKPTSNSVYIDAGAKLYVYGADGKYLGITGSMLPFTSKYYVSLKKYPSIVVK